MRPLIVLILVLLAATALLFTLNSGGDESATAELDGPQVAQPTEPAPAPAADLQAPTDTRSDAAATVVATEDDEDDEVLASGAVNSLSGRVLDISGQPIPNARVVLSRDPQMGEQITMQWFLGKEPTGKKETTTTNSDGEYLFEGIKPANDYFVMADHTDFCGAQEEMVQVGELGNFGVTDIVLAPGSSLEGYVLDVGGNQVVDAELHLDSAYMMGVDPESPDRITVTTDETGFYQFKNVGAGPRNLMVSADGYALQIKHNLLFKGEPGDKLEHSFSLEVGHPIAGRVFGPADEPLPGAKIIALNHNNDTSSRGEAISGEDGTFQIDGLQQGSYILLVELFGYRNARANRVQVDDMNVQIEMIKQACINGTVVGKSGAPESFTATVLRVSPNPSMGQTEPIYENTGVRERFTTADGSFELCGIDPGDYAIQVKSKGYAPSISPTFPVIDGQATPPVTIELSLGGTIKGRIVDPKGAPVAKALVKSADDEYAGNMLNDFLDGLIASRITEKKTRTDAQGYFELNLLNPGNYRIEVEHKGFTRETVAGLAVSEGQTVDAGTVRLKAGGTLSGKVYDQAGQPMTRGFVRMFSDDQTMSYQVRTDGEGNYRIEHVRPGSYKLSAMRNTVGGGGDAFNAILDQQHSEVAIQVADGAVITRDLTLGS